MNVNILSKDVQSFIQANRHVSPASMALKKSPFAEVTSSELANQIAGFQKTEKKIPDWTSSEIALYYPEKLNLEQCSSSETGKIKASLILPQTSLADLTGGFGVDSYYFAQKAANVTHCEINPTLSAIVEHNFEVLQAANIQCRATDGIAFLTDCEETFDYIYIDPSRRIKNQKVFRLEDCEPNILAYQDLFFKKAKTVITKLAPLLDISAALNSMPAVRDVYIISVDNDCKELLFIQEQGYIGKTNIHAVRLYQGHQQEFIFDYTSEGLVKPSFSKPQHYLYEPDVAITKAGAFKSIATAYNLHKLHQHSHLYTSNELAKDFPGKIILIEETLPFSVFKKQIQGSKANVIAKNFPLKVDDIRKKLKIKDGGDRYLYFTTDSTNELIVVSGRRI